MWSKKTAGIKPPTGSGHGNEVDGGGIEDVQGGKKGSSVVEEERKGKVIDLDDPEQEKQEEGRVQVAHSKSQEGEDWVKDNMPVRNSNEGRPQGEARVEEGKSDKRPEGVLKGAITSEGAVDADAFVEKAKKPVRQKKSTEESGAVQKKMSDKEDKKRHGSKKDVSDVLHIGWAAASGMGAVCLCSLMSAVMVYSARKRMGRGRSKNFEERFRMKAFDREDDL